MLNALEIHLTYGPPWREGKAETEATWRLLCTMDYNV